MNLTELKNLKLTDYIQRTIELCPVCHGKGYTITETLVDYHKNEYDEKEEKCIVCNGTGRVYKETIDLFSYVPYDGKQL